MQACTCVNEADPPKYPTRLIDLKSLWEAKPPKDKPLMKVEQPKATHVRLILGSEAADENDGQSPAHMQRYVTLSHCWGNPNSPPLRLLKANLEEFREGILLERLPLTFRHAVAFAARLDGVRYIWIDSLCIIQDDKDDWLVESQVMGDVYKNSFLNISATAARHGDDGIFYTRPPRALRDLRVDINVAGVPGVSPEDPSMRRCTLADPSFWHEHVDTAPVNTRGWVLQERLLAPRKLHFCSDQVVWECDEVRKSERHPDGLPDVQGEALEAVSSTGMAMLRSGRRPPSRVDGEGCDGHTISRKAYTAWKNIVEKYTRARFTKLEDRFIAITGVAQAMHAQIGAAYVAGLWRSNIECQLLWYVTPVWQQASQRFAYPSKRLNYEIPSFSWAAVDAEQGITYAGLLEDGLLIRVDEVEPMGSDDRGIFGMVKGLVVTGEIPLKKVELSSAIRDGGVVYSWRLRGKGDERLEIRFTILYLDSPETDKDIFGPEGRIYCFPAAYGAHGDSPDDLTCLLLQSDEQQRGTFKRIGLLVVTTLDGKGGNLMRQTAGYEGELPCICWEADAAGNGKGRHTIRIV